MRSVKSKLFPYIHDTWVASQHWSVPSTYNDHPAFTLSTSWGRQSHEGVSLKVPWRLPVNSFPTTNIMETDKHDKCRQLALSLSSHVVDVERHLTLMVTPSTYFSSTSVAPYSIISSILNWRICEILSNYLFGPREAGKSLVNSLSQDAFNA